MANLKNNPQKTIVTSTRPSSPRQFFERIYGHLETDNNVKPVCSPVQSELSASPDFLNDR